MLSLYIFIYLSIAV